MSSALRSLEYRESPACLAMARSCATVCLFSEARSRCSSGSTAEGAGSAGGLSGLPPLATDAALGAGFGGGDVGFGSHSATLLLAGQQSVSDDNCTANPAAAVTAETRIEGVGSSSGRLLLLPLVGRSVVPRGNSEVNSFSVSAVVVGGEGVGHGSCSGRLAAPALLLLAAGRLSAPCSASASTPPAALTTVSVACGGGDAWRAAGAGDGTAAVV
mmetsp:Transcript_12589/g.32257  ORF Transcript_12589/g.32257 Transcript_12589/m.32257 type:complete len:215 (-) Transcript_12589:1059-1703(-)